MFRALLNDKIGTVIRHFSYKVPHLSLTKLLKLLYITDETAMRETGSPVTWLEYRVWKLGPVAHDIYQEIKLGEKLSIADKIVSLDNYIRIDKRSNLKREGQEEVYILPLGQDNLDTLSDYEIGLLKRVLREFGDMNASELIHFLHQEGSLWHRAVEEKKLQLNFELFGNTSNHIIDFSDLIEEDEILKLSAHAAYENLLFQKSILEQQLA